MDDILADEALTDEEKKALEAESQEEAPEPEEISEEQASDEAQEEPDGKKDEPEKMVPLAALHEERKRRQELSEAIQKEREMRARIEERAKAILEMQQKQEKPQEPKLDPEEQPFDYMKHLGEDVSQLRQQMEAERAQMQQMQQMQQIIQYGNDQAARFRQQTGPEIYDKAFEHVYNARKTEIMALGYDENQANQVLQQEMQAAIVQAVQRNINPGQMLMDFAKARGFNPETKAHTDKAAVIEDGQKKMKGLGGSGKRVKAGLSVEDLANMPEEEFQRLVNSGKVSESDLNKLLGA